MKNTFSAYVRLSQTRTQETMQAAFHGSRAGLGGPLPGQDVWRVTEPPCAKGMSWRWCRADHTASAGGPVQRACYGRAGVFAAPRARRKPPDGGARDGGSPLFRRHGCDLVVSFVTAEGGEG
ncbi:hypothetical protein GCM10010398_70620 [Streptomyces fimbriatus]